MDSKNDWVTQEPEITSNDEIARLLEEKVKCIQEGNYIQAEAIKQKLKDLQGNSDVKKKKDLDSQHAMELKQLEDSYNKEITLFKESWEKKLEVLETEAEEREQNLNLKHQKELESVYTQYEQLQKLQKHSTAYLEFKQCEAECVKQERFIEAHQFKVKAEQVAKEEEDKCNREKNDKIKKKVDILMKEQEEEKAKMMHEINFVFENERKIRDKELEKLVQKYKNQKLALELQQKQEKVYASNSNLLKAKTSYQFHREPSGKQRGKQYQDPELKMKEMHSRSKNMNSNEKPKETADERIEGLSAQQEEENK